jgi:ATP-dependent DNA helicase RecG
LKPSPGFRYFVYVAKGLLPYHGLGSGIVRALDAWPRIDFADDRDGCLFTATVHRKPVGELILDKSSPKSSPKGSSKTEDQILEMIRGDPYTTTQAMGDILGITKRAVIKQVNKLKAQGRLRRVGPAKGGHWEAIE